MKHCIIKNVISVITFAFFFWNFFTVGADYILCLTLSTAITMLVIGILFPGLIKRNIELSTVVDEDASGKTFAILTFLGFLASVTVTLFCYWVLLEFGYSREAAASISVMIDLTVMCFIDFSSIKARILEDKDFKLIRFHF